MKQVMIQLIIILLFSMTAFSLPINECKTDIYFGNGVWNDSDVAKENAQALHKRIIQREIIKGDPTLEAKFGEVKLAYNWHTGYMLDLLETYYQLKENGEIKEQGFFSLMRDLLTLNPDSMSAAMHRLYDQLLQIIASTEQANVNEMLQKYYDNSFRLGHRVLLVSHSQGNLFANRVYDSISPDGYKNYFANLQVASPASSVHAAMGAYVTGWIDPVINPIPGSMESNADLDSPGHSFIGAYLGSKDTYTKIVGSIKSLLKQLDNTPSQWKITNEPFDRSSCETIRAEVEHKFDPQIGPLKDVYPFKTNDYKLYPLPSGQYVLAECGGKEIEEEWSGKKFDECYRLTPNSSIIIFKPETTFIHGHNLSAFLPDGLGTPVGYIDNSTGCATIHVPQGYITFYQLKSGYTSCVPEYTFGYASGQIYTCLPASYFQLIGSISVEKFLQQARYQGKIDVCGGTNSYFISKDDK